MTNLPPAKDDRADGLEACMTELQRALVLLRDAHAVAIADGRRMYVVFLDIAATLIAREIARVTDFEDLSKQARAA
jgi:hypothetical protein